MEAKLQNNEQAACSCSTPDKGAENRSLQMELERMIYLINYKYKR